MHLFTWSFVYTVNINWKADAELGLNAPSFNFTLNLYNFYSSKEKLFILYKLQDKWRINRELKFSKNSFKVFAKRIKQLSSQKTC